MPRPGKITRYSPNKTVTPPVESQSHHGHRHQEDGRKRLGVGMHHLSTQGKWQLMNGGHTLRAARIDAGRKSGSQGSEM